MDCDFRRLASGVHLGAPADSQRGAEISPGALRQTKRMRDEYDFSKAERGKLHRPDAVLAPPVHLDPAILAFLVARAQAHGVTLSELVNALPKKDIESIAAAE